MRVIIPLDRLESYLSSYDVDLLVHYGIPLHKVVAECVRVALEQSFEREVPMAKDIFVEELYRDNRYIISDLAKNRGFAPTTEDKIVHCTNVMYVVYRQLFHYINNIAAELFTEVGMEYNVNVSSHYILPDGALFMDIDADYFPFNLQKEDINHVEKTVNTTYRRHRRGI